MQLNPVKETRLGPIDVVACASTLGHLLRFVKGEGLQFRMLVEVIGSTVHLIRRENSPHETIPDIRGYGHRFPETYTTWDADVRGSASHQRILGYQFAGLGCLVRFKGDGYLPDKAGSIPEKQGENSTTSLETVTAKLATTGVAPVAPKRGAGSLPLQINPGGRVIPQEAVFDLKTRSVKSDPDIVMATELPRWWLAQIPNFILARHQFGRFNDIEVKDIRKDVEIWESTNADTLSRFASLLHRIVGVARGRKDGKMEILREADQPILKILEQLPEVPAAFSVQVARRWKSWLSGTGNLASGVDHEHEGEATDSDEDWVEFEGDFTFCSEECEYCGRCAR
ncbi:hypothetical protein ACRALDRAFT_1063103 [Sodiomyces alcalophilus JCM 7366]|uniref:uncharacterized protein n=1 Tax=Sodiomyces alcalophilus JCM 7366 TaxID=591952 RepID=UPI0039B3F260